MMQEKTAVSRGLKIAFLVGIDVSLDCRIVHIDLPDGDFVEPTVVHILYDDTVTLDINDDTDMSE